MSDDYYDISDKLGDLYPGYSGSEPEWKMYSFSRPACILWNAVANQLHKAGWTDEKIKDWLQSKSPRWALDGKLGNAIEKLGDEFALSLLDDLR